MENKTTRCAIYARCSTLLKGQDPQLQVVNIEEFAKRRGFIITQRYVDSGISGANEKRPALDEMMRDAQKRFFDVIIISGLDRLGRSVVHMLNLISELDNYGVGLISAISGSPNS